MDAQEAKKVIEEEKLTRSQRVLAAINELCKTERCQLRTSMTLTDDNRILPQLSVIALDLETDPNASNHSH